MKLIQIFDTVWPTILVNEKGDLLIEASSDLLLLLSLIYSRLIGDISQIYPLPSKNQVVRLAGKSRVGRGKKQRLWFRSHVDRCFPCAS